jgi:hypothetical protein
MDGLNSRMNGQDEGGDEGETGVSRGGGKAMQSGAIANAPGTGRFIGSKGLTRKQKSFVQAFCANGGRQTDAARAAGYENPHGDAYRLLRNSAVIEAIHRETSRRVATGGAVGVGVLIEIAQDKAAPHAARATCAKWLAESAGFGLAARRAGAADGPGDRPMEEWTLAQLDAFIHGGLKELERVEAGKASAIDGEARRIAHEQDPEPGES